MCGIRSDCPVLFLVEITDRKNGEPGACVGFDAVDELV